MRTPDFITYEKKDCMEVVHITPSLLSVTRILVTVPLKDSHVKNSLLLSFFAEMLERGSHSYTKDVYEEKLESLGAQVDIRSSGEDIELSVTARTSTISEVVKILQKTLKAPLFASAEIAKLKKEIAQVFREEKDDTRFLASALFSRALYTESDSSYIPTVETRKKHLTQITEKELHKVHAHFLERFWQVSIASTTQIKEEVCAVFAHLHSTECVRYLPVTPSFSPLKGKTLYDHVLGKQNIEFFMGNRLALTLSDDAFVAFAFGLDVLGKRGGFSGRLMSTVREKEGLTYMIYAWVSGATMTEYGHWNICTFFTAKDTPAGISSTLREVKKIVEQGISLADLTKFKELLRNQFRLAHESAASALALYHGALVAGRTPDDVYRLLEKRDALTRHEVNQALKTYLDVRNIVIAGAGPTTEISKNAFEKK